MSVSSVLKISEAASLALHTTVYLAANPDRNVPTKEMAEALSVSEAHLAKVMQRLVHHGLAKSVRGPKGGFSLNKPANEIALLDAFEAIEGPFNPSDCLFENDRPCPGMCILGDLVGRINNEVRDYLTGTTVADMTGVFTGRNNEAA